MDYVHMSENHTSEIRRIQRAGLFDINFYKIHLNSNLMIWNNLDFSQHTAEFGIQLARELLSLFDQIFL